jgi:hypothetical protein
MPKLAVSVALLALAGCVPYLSQTGPLEKPLRPDCPVRLLTVAPSAPFTELAVVWDLNSRLDVPALTEQLRPFVCKAGGNAAIVRRCDDSACSATVIKLNQPEPGAGEAASGCQYDTQCKGDRLCVAGRCTDPAPK